MRLPGSHPHQIRRLTTTTTTTATTEHVDTSAAHSPPASTGDWIAGSGAGAADSAERWRGQRPRP